MRNAEHRPVPIALVLSLATDDITLSARVVNRAGQLTTDGKSYCPISLSPLV
jgi:hypothetical protein